MFIPPYFESLHILHENTLPDRSYYIPASQKRDDLVRRRESSDRIQMLSGIWRFRYWDSIHDLTPDVFHESDRSTEVWDQIPVPGVWQNFGYDTHQYTNVKYPFPLDPPYVPVDNPCGVYVLDFDYHRDPLAPRAYLNFEGVDSCFYLWLNGAYAGYSQVSHSTSEFDVTGFLREGSNRLAVLARYLDKETPVRVSLSDSLTSDVVSVSWLEPKSPHPDYTHHAVLRIPHPRLWNPEDPHLYFFFLESDFEVITDRVGMREIKIKDRVVTVNGKPIKFRGVNRHDSDPITGPVFKRVYLGVSETFLESEDRG